MASSPCAPLLLLLLWASTAQIPWAAFTSSGLHAGPAELLELMPRCPVTFPMPEGFTIYDCAKAFVSGKPYGSGMDDKRGPAQLGLLRRLGLRRELRVLEIGCGALDLASLLVPLLGEDCYVCVDPNPWLGAVALHRKPELLLEVMRKRAIFLAREDFSAGLLGRKFDVVFSHSTLTHVTEPLLRRWLRAVKDVLATDGVVLASHYFRNNVSSGSRRAVASVVRSSGEALGVELDRASGLEVLAVRPPPSVLGVWTVEQEAAGRRGLHRGDRIVEVNGRRTPEAITTALDTAGDLAITFAWDWVYPDGTFLPPSLLRRHAKALGLAYSRPRGFRTQFFQALRDEPHHWATFRHSAVEPNADDAP
mmetsp:Transcript_25443/g.70924  ORF Transcript_25443/g.70924 Transcript_25443/m.70924 type:complete len:364 (-) Transcript_25443:105-1196(-)